MHYGGDIPYFVPFRNALQSITEVTTPLFLYLITHGIYSNIDKFAQNLANGFIILFLFHENQPQIMSKLRVHNGSDKVLPPFKNTYFYYFKLFIS